MVAGILPLLCEQFHCVRIKFESYLIHYREEFWLMHFKSTPNACFQNCGHQKLKLPRGKFTAWLATVQVPCVISHHGSLGPQWRVVTWEGQWRCDPLSQVHGSARGGDLHGKGSGRMPPCADLLTFQAEKFEDQPAPGSHDYMGTRNMEHFQ